MNFVQNAITYEGHGIFFLFYLVCQITYHFLYFICRQDRRYEKSDYHKNNIDWKIHKQRLNYYTFGKDVLTCFANKQNKYNVNRSTIKTSRKQFFTIQLHCDTLTCKSCF